MGGTLRDCKVEYRREEDIADTALAWRRAAQNENCGYFNVVDFFEIVLQRQFKKGRIFLDFLAPYHEEGPAYVSFNPLTLHVEKEIWELARLGDPEARFIIAHEIGHLILHSHDAKHFSDDPKKQINFAENEHSAEWQANIFAYYFLLPTHIVVAFGDVQGLTTSCSVTERLATERRQTVIWANLHPAKFVPTTRYQGDACGECGNFTVVANGSYLQCDTCKKRTYEWTPQACETK
jgi:hypothetical protein